MKRAGWSLLVLCFVALPAAAEPSPWDGYLDFAYVYSSAEPEALRVRLDDYGREAGIRLEDHIALALGRAGSNTESDPEVRQRRAAIAHLLLYLASGNGDRLDQSVAAVEELADSLDRHENRYWYHYILAHRALERDRPYDFAGELLDLWLHAIVSLEAPYETLRNLSLSEAPGSGFVAALPYLHENLSRLILIRSQQLGVTRDLDALGGLVRMLYDGRVGTHPDVIPLEYSSLPYLERIVSRLDGVESDAGSLTFTLALFEASKYHDEARALLAERGFAAETLKALRVASGAYEAALDQSVTLSGRAAVYTRVLRQLGEVYAAKQRLGVDPDIETPFSIEGAIEVYSELRESAGEIERQGYRDPEAYLTAMHRLWEEIQETSLNAADYYLTRAVEKRPQAATHARSAARIYARYLSFFQTFATQAERAAIPDSAYFAAYEAARGYGHALLTYTHGRLSRAEMDQAARRYVAALHLFPFDRQLWAALTTALERIGRQNDYLDLARPVAEAVTASRHLDVWIQNGEPGSRHLGSLRRALADSQVIVYLGFAEERTVTELEASLAELRSERDDTESHLLTLSAQRQGMGRRAVADPVPASADFDVEAAAVEAVDVLEVATLDREIDQVGRRLERLDKQIAARTDALPLFKATLGSEALVDELRARRDHPVHTLLRRMYHETRP